MNKIKKGDNVVVITGKDKGKKGAVLSVLSNGERLVIAGVNLVSKCYKPDPNKRDEGGIKKIEKSIHRSNVMLIDPESDKPSRIYFKINDDGQRIRCFRKSNKEVNSIK